MEAFYLNHSPGTHPHSAVLLCTGETSRVPIKADPERYGIRVRQQVVSDLNRLSCRWRPIPAQRGKVLSLIVAPTDGRDFAVIGRIIQSLEVTVQHIPRKRDC
jgi:hypothetical protein